MLKNKLFLFWFIQNKYYFYILNTKTMTFTTTTNIFAPFNYLTNMALIIDIEGALIGNQSIIALGIKRALYDQTPAVYILKEIREMAEDNRLVMEDMLGVSLVKRIMI